MRVILFILTLLQAIPSYCQASVIDSTTKLYIDKFLQVEYVDTVAMRIYSDSAIYYAKKSEDKATNALALRYKGWYYQDVANYTLAEESLKESLKLYEELHHKQEIANAYGNLGTVYMDLKRHTQAINNQLKSLQINNDIIRDKPNKEALDLAIKSKSASLSNLSTLFNDLGELDKAISYQKESIKHELYYGDSNALGLAISYHSLAISYRSAKMLDSAMVYIDKAIPIYQSHAYNLGISQSYIQKGRIYDAMENYQEAEEYIYMGYELALETGNQKDIAIGASNLCALHIRMNEPNKALKYLDKLKVYNTQTNDINNLQNLYTLQSDYFSLIEQSDSALFYYKLSIQLRDSVFNREKDKKIIYAQYQHQLREQVLKDSIEHQAAIQTEQLKIENEKAKAQAEKSKRDILIVGVSVLGVLLVFSIYISLSRKRINKELIISLKEREVLLKEIHHRVKNNLQIVSSLLNLQSQSLEETESREILQLSQNRLQTMALIHEKLYQSDSLKEINIKDYMSVLLEHILDSHALSERSITLEIQGDDKIISIDQLVPCGLIVNELLTNSIKYAFPDKREGKIHVHIKSSGELCTVVVADNGIGVPEDKLNGSVKSLGMRLAHGLCRQLKSKLQYRYNNGAEFSFTFGATTG